MEPKIWIDPIGKIRFNANAVKPGHATVDIKTPVQPSDEQKAKLDSAIAGYIAVYDADDDTMYAAFDKMEGAFADAVANIRSRMQ